MVREFALEASEAAVQAIQHSTIVQELGDKRFALVVLAEQAANVLDDLTLSFKQPSFQGEQEWRLIRVVNRNTNPEEISFRDSPLGLIPYRSMYVFDPDAIGIGDATPAPHFPLRELRFGPALDPRHAEPALALFLLHTAADDHSIRLDRHVPVHRPAAILR